MIVTKEFDVTGMQCTGCKAIIKEALLHINVISISNGYYQNLNHACNGLIL